MAQTKTTSKKSSTATRARRPRKSSSEHHGAKIAAVIIVILILIFGGLAIWFFAFYNNSEKVALDAVAHLFTADNVSFEGDVSLFLNNESESESGITGALLSLDSASNHLPMANTAKLQLTFDPEKVKGEPKVLITLKNVILKNGVLYFQIGGLIDSLNTFSYTLEQWSAIEEYLPMIEAVDNEWWQIDFNQILQDINLLASQRNTLTQVYSCVVEAMNRDNSAEMSRLYREHRFVNVTPANLDDIAAEITSWHNTYEVSINRTELANYINALPETEAANEFYACFNAVENDATVPLSLDATDFDEISASDIDIPEDLHIYIVVSTFGHQLSKIYINQNTDDYHFGGSIAVKYQEATVSAPDNYRPISDLFEEFIELLDIAIPEYEEI